MIFPPSPKKGRVVQRANAVGGKDGSNLGNTKVECGSHIPWERAVRGPAQVSRKKIPEGNRAFLELYGEFEIVLR